MAGAHYRDQSHNSQRTAIRIAFERYATGLQRYLLTSGIVIHPNEPLEGETDDDKTVEDSDDG